MRASTRLRMGMDAKKVVATLFVAEVVEQQVISGQAQRALDSVDHLGEEPAVDERDDDAHGGRAPAGQPGGERRGDVVELSAAASTRSRVAVATSGSPRSARDTVAIDTPASRATSSMLAAIRVLLGALPFPRRVNAIAAGSASVSPRVVGTSARAVRDT